MAARGRYGAVSRRNPEAAGVCDRGGEVRKLRELKPEMMWAGNRLVPTGFLCCDQHRDPPHPQDRIPPVFADPQPIINPRPDMDAVPDMVGTVLTDDHGIILSDDSGKVLTP